jgi:hypothetical protein
MHKQLLGGRVSMIHCLEAVGVSVVSQLLMLLLLLPLDIISHTMPCSLIVRGCAAQWVNMARHIFTL